MIDWKPIDEMPEELKDGREVLLAGRWWSGRWEVRAGAYLATRWPFVGGAEPTHYAEITEPGG